MRLADQDGRLLSTTQLIVLSLTVGLLGVLYSIRAAFRNKRGRGKVSTDKENMSKRLQKKQKNKSAK